MVNNPENEGVQEYKNAAVYMLEEIFAQYPTVLDEHIFGMLTNGKMVVF